MQYKAALFAVRDIQAARKFYEEVLGQRVVMDLGKNLDLGGFALQEDFGGLAGFDPALTEHQAYNAELYFEVEDLDACDARLRQHGVRFLHGIREYPWGQRVLRAFDPDGNLLEMGESMEMVVRRLFAQGLTLEEVAEKTTFPVEVVKGWM